jgi:hypothetical protein
MKLPSRSQQYRYSSKFGEARYAPDWSWLLSMISILLSVREAWSQVLMSFSPSRVRRLV